MADSLKARLARIGENPTVRRAILDALRAWEEGALCLDFDPREAVTGALVDALFANAGVVDRNLTSGLSLALPYRSKIAREFAMGSEPLEHVWEPQTTKLLMRLAGRSKHALVGGAYAGDQAVPIMSVLAGHGGTCHCFEPNREEAEALAANAARNGLKNYRLNYEGLWRQNTAMRFEGAKDSHASSVPVTDGGRVDFHAVSIDSYCARQSEGPIILDLIMLDIEGGEHDALIGAVEQLSRPEGPVIVFEVHRSYLDWSQGLENTTLLKYLASHGYTCFALRDYQANVNMGGMPIEVIPADRCYLEGPPHGFNMVALKDLGFIQALDLRVCLDVSPKLLLHRDPALHQPMNQV